MELQRSYNPLSAYSELPEGVRFSDQREDEDVVVLLRQHAIVNFRWIVALVVGLVGPIVLYAGDWGLDPGYWSQAVLDSLLMIWYVGLIGFALEIFLVWHYNVYIISNRRVVDNEFKGLLRFSSSEAGLASIENVVHRQTGTWQLLFDYGNVTIKTAAAGASGSGTLTFDRVPQPARVASVLNEMVAESRKRQRSRGDRVRGGAGVEPRMREGQGVVEENRKAKIENRNKVENRNVKNEDGNKEGGGRKSEVVKRGYRVLRGDKSGAGEYGKKISRRSE